MQIQRRSFLLSILAAGVAPAIARAGVLMPVKPRLVPVEYTFMGWSVERILATAAHPEGYRDVTGDPIILAGDRYTSGPFGYAKRWRPEIVAVRHDALRASFHDDSQRIGAQVMNRMFSA